MSLARKAKDPRVRVGLVILVSAIALLGLRELNSSIETTDNATVQCDWSDVIPEVRGIIKEIHFEDDQFVEANQLIITLEDTFYKAQYERAQAEFVSSLADLEIAKEAYALAKLNIEGDVEISKSSLLAAAKNLSSLELDIKVTETELESEKTKLERLSPELKRIESLYKQNYVSSQQFEQIKSDHKSTISKVSGLEAKLEMVKNRYEAEKFKLAEVKKNTEVIAKSEQKLKSSSLADLNKSKSQVDIARANRDIAKLNLERASIKAKRSGYITNRKISSGQFLEIGQPISSIVSCQEKSWVQANFKETQIHRIKQNQEVTFTIDAYPETRFAGIVKSISDGSGATFSVLPPENASGNFTKVVKRFPTKIEITETHGLAMRVGMSAVVDVFVE